MPPKWNIVIAGGGIAGWLTASVLARLADAGIGTITVVESKGIDDSLGVPCTVQTTLPSTPSFLKRIGIDENVALRATQGSFTLGRAMSNWTGAAAPGFHAYGEIGASLGPVAFHQLVAKIRSGGEVVNLANYSVAALCAQSGRFARPSEDSRSVLSTMEYGLHLDSAAYTAFLKQDALALGVAVISGEIEGVELDDGGLIAALKTTGDQSIVGDLYIDCTGHSAKIIGQMPDCEFEDWSQWLPCNRAVSRSYAGNTPLPFTHVDAHSAGWQSFSSLQNQQGELFVYHGDSLPDLQSGDLPHMFTSGRRAKAWVGNCVAIGGAAAVIDPVASSQMALTENAITRLIGLLPHDRTCRIEAAEYNRQTREEHDCIFDFVALHYKANKRVGDPFWDACRNHAVPDRLAHRIAVYESCGRIVLYDGEIFEAASWVALYEALSVFPRRYDAMANGIDAGQMVEHLKQIRGVMLSAVGACPPLRDYLALQCAAPIYGKIK
jgi:tryptophan 7-halogenase